MQGSILYLVLKLRGGGQNSPEFLAKIREEKKLEEDQLKEKFNSELKSEMTVAPGGFINQTIVRDPVRAEDWDTKNVIMFNLQLLNTFAFEHLLGIKAPPTPVSNFFFLESPSQCFNFC